MSREVEVQLERQQFIRDKIFDNVPDEVESVFSRNLDSNVTMDIRITDDDPL